MDFEQIYKTKLKKVSGLETNHELELIFNTVLNQKPKVAVEIGTLFGLSASTIIAALPEDSDLYCIENFAVQGSDTKPYFKEKVLSQYPNMHLMEMDSSKAAHEFFKEIDFLFIDGDHQDDGIQRDLKNWLPKVKSGGVIAFHDYFNDMFPSIKRRVEEVTRDWKSIGQADSLMIKVKP